MWAKALVLVNPTVLEVILQDLFASAELLRFPYYGLDPSLRRPRGFQRCRAPSWFHWYLEKPSTILKEKKSIKIFGQNVKIPVIVAHDWWLFYYCLLQFNLRNYFRSPCNFAEIVNGNEYQDDSSNSGPLFAFCYSFALNLSKSA